MAAWWFCLVVMQHTAYWSWVGGIEVRLLLSVSDTLPGAGRGVGGSTGGWVGGSKAFFSDFWEAWTPPPQGEDGIYLGAGFASLGTQGH